MESYKKRFYTFLKDEIDRFEQGESQKEPFLYAYLRKKKEGSPRLVILRGELACRLGGCKSSEAVAEAAARLLGREALLQKRCRGCPPPGWKGLLAAVERSGLAASPAEALAVLSSPDRATGFLEHPEARLLSPDLCRALVEDVLAVFPRNEKRNDRYVQLRERELRLQREGQADGWRYFLYLLDFVEACDLPVTGEIFARFESVWETVRRAVPALSMIRIPPEGKAGPRFRKRLAELRAAIDEAQAPDALPEIFPETLPELTELLLRAVIKADAAAWLYDAGYPVREQQRDGRTRKADRTMELLDEFYRDDERVGAFEGRACPRTRFTLDEAREDITRLFALLDRDEKRKKVVVPLAIDSATGAGLYIVGTDFFQKRSKSFAAYCHAHRCCYTVACPAEFRSGGSGSILHQMEYVCEDRIADAYAQYLEITDLSGEDWWFTYDYYQGNNSYAPEGCPEAYARYFGARWDEPEPERPEAEASGRTVPGKGSANASRRLF